MFARAIFSGEREHSMRRTSISSPLDEAELEHSWAYCSARRLCHRFNNIKEGYSTQYRKLVICARTPSSFRRLHMASVLLNFGRLIASSVKSIVVNVMGQSSALFII